MKEENRENIFEKKRWNKPVLMELDIKMTLGGGDPNSCEDEFNEVGSLECNE